MAENAECYTDMAAYMKEAVGRDPSLSQEERNLLAAAFKNLLGEKKVAWQTLQEKEEGELARRHREEVEEEVVEICEDAVSLADSLLPGAKDKESEVFFLRMKADYQRRQLETMAGDDTRRRQLVTASEENYKRAFEAAKELSSTHPTRLGVALNYSVFQQEILNNRERACELAKTAFDDAISQLDTLAEDSYKDSTLVMQLLRDNLTLWTTEEEPEPEE